MTFFWIIFFLVLGFAVLIKGAEIFVDASAGMARKLGVSEFLIGITLVALGTSLPEFFVTIVAGLSHSSGLAIGDIIGSNIANIALILGICGMITTIKIQPDTLIKRDIPFLILSGVVLLILGFDQIFQNHDVTYNRLGLGDGLILLVFFLIFLFYILTNFKSSQALKSQMEQKEKIQSKERILFLSLKICGGLFALIGGGKLIVDNAISLASLLGVSQSVIGLTIVALGTSLPEAATSFVAIKKKQTEIGIGNIIGSNTINIFLVLGLVSTFTPLDLSPTLITDTIILIVISFLVFFMAFFRKQIGRYFGTALVLIYSGYIFFVCFRDLVTKWFS